MMITQLLKTGGISSKKRFLQAAALVAVGSALLYMNRNTDASSGESIISEWSILRDHYLIPFDQLSKGSIQLVVSKFGLDPSDDFKQNAATGTHGSKSITTAVAMVNPAVVYISIPWKLDGKTSGCSHGSGTLIDSDGTILTCAHLVSDNQGRRVTSRRKVDVTLQDGRTFVGSVVNADLHSDIAIVKISSRTPFPSAKLGCSSKLRPGEVVVTMGAPLSHRNSITAGIVSCVDRKSSEMGLGGMLREYIQTDCVTNPGYSGGPLINLDGEVVGVHVMGVKPGLSAAVPIDSVLRIMEQFKSNGKFIRPWLGSKMLDLDKKIISQLRIKEPTFPNMQSGVLVLMVNPGSPADLAGLRPGDVVFEFRGKPVGSIKEINQLMEDQIGIPSKIVVKRAKDVVTLTVVPEAAIPQI